MSVCMIKSLYYVYVHTAHQFRPHISYEYCGCGFKRVLSRKARFPSG